MALFNKTKKVAKTTNRAGGQAYTQNPKMQLASLLLTSFAQDQFYRGQKQTFGELAKLISKCDPLFAAKAGIYARTKFGMRSISHALAAEIAAYASGKSWSKDFYDKIVYRPDDMLEILSYYLIMNGKKMPNAMKKGFAKAFDKFDNYQLAKYRGENKAVKLIDLVNMVHPTPTDRNATALKQLVEGTLRSTETWESKLTQAGQRAENKEQKNTLKAKAWKDLIEANKLGYFAMLRNLRNIHDQAPNMLPKVIENLTNRTAIKKSLVLPFRFVSAMDALQEANITNRALLNALNKAVDISLDNVPKFDGHTLIVLDDSGSMTGRRAGQKSPIQIGSLFSAVLYKAIGADFMRFSDKASYKNFNPGDATMSIANNLVKSARAGGTNFHAIFNEAKRAYDRIIILSDMQGWIGYYSPKEAFKAYKKRTGANPYIYSYDLQG